MSDHALLSTQAMLVLQRTRHLIREPSNWHKGYRTLAPTICLLQALIQAQKDVLWSYNYHGDLINILTAYLPNGFPSLTIFNDAIDVTHADVMQVLDRAIMDVS